MAESGNITGILGQSFSHALTSIVAAVVILLLGFIIGRIAGRLIQRLLHDLSVNKFLRERFHITFSVEEIIGVLVSYGTYLAAIIIALNYIGITKEVAGVISAIVVLIVLIFITLAVKDFIPNLIAGIYIQRRLRLRTGMKITIRNTKGEVVRAGLIETTIMTKRGETIVIPNALFLSADYRYSKKS